MVLSFKMSTAKQYNQNTKKIKLNEMKCNGIEMTLKNLYDDNAVPFVEN